MQNSVRTHKVRSVVLALVAGLSLSAAAVAQNHGGGGGGGGGHASGFSGGGGHAGYSGHPGGGYHGGAYGWRGGGGYGWHGGGYGYGYGWRGGYGYAGWRGYGGWGWGWGGLGYGLFFASLPLYYSTYWWGGVPYYYANDNYYMWNGSAGQYETVAPPPQVAAQAGAGQPSGAGAANGTLFAYPKNGQTAEQQSKDTFECHQWAAGQTGFDPTLAGSAAATPGAGAHANVAPPPAATGSPGRQQDYMRAQAACLEGRGYSVQ
jgi:hypothetical protein